MLSNIRITISKTIKALREARKKTVKDCRIRIVDESLFFNHACGRRYRAQSRAPALGSSIDWSRVIIHRPQATSFTPKNEHNVC